MSINLESITQGQLVDFKFGLSTRQIEKTENNTFLIHDTSGGWLTAEVTNLEMQELLEGKKELLDLSWQ